MESGGKDEWCMDIDWACSNVLENMNEKVKGKRGVLKKIKIK